MNRGTTIEIVAALMHEPRTQAGLQEYVGCSEKTVSEVLRAMHDRGLVRRVGKESRVGNCGSGDFPVLWSLQTTPFASPDAV